MIHWPFFLRFTIIIKADEISLLTPMLMVYSLMWLDMCYFLITARTSFEDDF